MLVASACNERLLVLELGSSVRDSLRSRAVSRVSRKQESRTSRTKITDNPVLSFTRVY